MKKALPLIILPALSVLTAGFTPLAGANPGSRQTVDPNFNPRVTRPAYSNLHPRILFDEAHNNADTSGGRYKPFVELIRSDGYSVAPNARKLSRTILTGYSVLIIVNASGPQTERDAPAFTPQECDAVRDWVTAGGSLLLVSDHLPFSAAVSSLAERFNIDLTKGFTIDPVHHNKDSGDETELVFNRENGLLTDHAITRGRSPNERTNNIMTFSGTSLKGPPGSVALLKLADTAIDVLPPEPKKVLPEEALPEHLKASAAGRSQGLALEAGKGRVVVLGEAAMLTAQIAPKGFQFGMNVPNIDNRQFALNVLHWLSRLLK